MHLWAVDAESKHEEAKIAQETPLVVVATFSVDRLRHDVTKHRCDTASNGLRQQRSRLERKQVGL